jgi:hypothetical protein
MQIIHPDQPTYILSMRTRQDYDYEVGVYSLEDAVIEASRSHYPDAVRNLASPVVVKNLAGEVVVGGDRLRDAVARYLRYREQQMA